MALMQQNETSTPNEVTKAQDNDKSNDAGDILRLIDPSKYVTLPVQHEEIWDKYQQSIDYFWTFYGVSIADKDKMAKFTEQQRLFIHQSLAFAYLVHHTITNKELFMQLMERIDIKEASYYLGSQADQCKTHEVMYSMLLDECLTSEQRDSITRDVARKPEVRALLKWFLQNLNSDDQTLTRRIAVFAGLQGIVLESLFVLYSWIEKQYPAIFLTGLYESNALIWRDEKLNLSFSCMLFDYLEDELNHAETSDLIKEVVVHAKNIFTTALPSSMIEMDCELISDYIEHSADKILSDLRIGRLFFKESPFDWVVEPKIETEKKEDMKAAKNEETAFSTDIDF